eukprot:COSAG02_NODE_26043_length_642_cov_1.217311_1_plen_44_part_10
MRRYSIDAHDSVLLHGAGKLKRLLRPGVDDAAAAYLAKVEAAHN